MRIDYNKLPLMLLPSFVRQVRMVALLRVLVAPIGRLSVELLEWFEWRRIRVAATPQAKWIEYIVLREAGLAISIRQGSHLPWDFIVGISIDETNIDMVDAKRKAESLIDRYKQAGRRWIFDNDMLVPSARFEGFVCQLEAQTARFAGFVCSWAKEVNWVSVNGNGRAYCFDPADVLLTVIVSVQDYEYSNRYYVELHIYPGETLSRDLYNSQSYDAFVSGLSYAGSESDYEYKC